MTASLPHDTGSHHQKATLTEINLLLWFTAFSMLDSVGASYTSHLRFIPAESMKRYEHPQVDAGGEDEGSAERCSAEIEVMRHDLSSRPSSRSSSGPSSRPSSGPSSRSSSGPSSRPFTSL